VARVRAIPCSTEPVERPGAKEIFIGHENLAVNATHLDQICTDFPKSFERRSQTIERTFIVCDALGVEYTIGVDGQCDTVSDGGR
jgi:hypothetical protein